MNEVLSDVSGRSALACSFTRNTSSIKVWQVPASLSRAYAGVTRSAVVTGKLVALLERIATLRT